MPSSQGCLYLNFSESYVSLGSRYGTQAGYGTPPPKVAPSDLHPLVFTPLGNALPHC